MLKALTAIKTALVTLLEWTLIASLGCLVLDVIWQVTSRYVLRSPSSWTDELATLLMIWVALLGASVAFIKHGHLGVDVLVNRLAPRRRLLVEILGYALIGLFAAVILIYGGMKLVNLTLVTKQVSPALNLKMGHVYLALPISGFFTLVFSLETIVERLVQLRQVAEEKA
jgi:TRAP-type C4-dicarboxylate transport system permease small subunit